MKLADAVNQFSKKLDGLHTEIAEEFLKQVMINTPVKTGNLQQSWRINTANRSELHIVNDASYAVYVELGTERMSPRLYTTYTMRQIQKIIDRAAVIKGIK